MHALFGLLQNLGPMELLIILAICLLLFGSRLPSRMRDLGRGIRGFKEGLYDQGGDSTDTKQESLENKSANVNPQKTEKTNA